jgi:hypothetical protein
VDSYDSFLERYRVQSKGMNLNAKRVAGKSSMVCTVTNVMQQCRHRRAARPKACNFLRDESFQNLYSFALILLAGE